MAPQKRTRYGDSDDDGEVAAASSTLRHNNQRKRARTSTTNHDDSSSSDDGSTNNVEDEEMSMPPATQYEIIRDAGFKHLDNPDRDDEIATQQFLANTQQVGDNLPAENGIIEEIVCVNFMNHERLSVKLGPLINFVVGMNGSGKSAVLTAITLCLGGKPSSTNRGSSMKSLIKSGTEQGMLVIKLKNQGDGAYQPDVYGKTIIIERHFTQSNGSSYKLKSATGRIISTKKSDMDDVIEYFQLQVDNPMNVLTQDEAKTFITKSTPAMKYQFFVKGVQLQQLDNDYALVNETSDQIEAILKENADDFQALEKDLEKAQAKEKVVRQHDKMRAEKKKLGRQLTWCQIVEQENELEERKKNVAATQQKIERQEKLVDERSQYFEVVNNSVERAEEKAKKLEEELIPLNEAHQEAKSESDAVDAEVQKVHTDQRGMGQELKQAQTKAAKIQSEIDAELQRIEAANGGSHARKLAEIENAKEAALQAQKAFEDTHDELRQLNERSQAAKSAVAKSEVPLAAKNNEIKICEEQVRSAERERPNPIAGFVPEMPALLDRINRDGGFRQKPVGPIGLHLKLRDPKWSSILEVVLGGTLNAFVVTTQSDQVRLQRMMNQVGVKYSNIFIGNSQHIDTLNEPDPQFMTVLRMLDIDNGLARNTLIINHAIEQLLLVDDRDDAFRIMQPGSSSLANVKQCYTHNPTRRGWGIRLFLTGNNNQNSGSDFVRPLPAQRTPRMATDSETRLLLLKDTLKQLQMEASELRKIHTDLQRKASDAEKSISLHKNNQAKLKVKAQKTADAVEALETELANLGGDDGLLDALRKSLEGANGDFKMYERVYGDAGYTKLELNKKANEKKSILKAAKQHVANHEKLINDARSKLKNKQSARTIALTEKNSAIDDLEHLKNQKGEEEQRVQNQIERVADFTSQASKVCQRVEVPSTETRTSLDSKLSSLTNQLKRYADQAGATDQEIVDAVIMAKERLENARANRKEQTNLLALIKLSILQRMEQFRTFQRLISARSRINFNYLLSERAFRGKLTIDHRNKLLDVHVEPDETSRSKKGRETKTLSGGEKSFSSICLLLSLWEAMGAPLRCLDEFDVFMDDVNRDVSTKMIISAARRAVGKQFILITPKALGNGVDVDDDVHVIKLTDPRDPKERRIDHMMENNR